MNNHENLKRILKYILQYSLDNTNNKIIEKINDIVLITGKDKVIDFLTWHKLLSFLPDNNLIENNVVRIETKNRNERLLEMSRIISDSLRKSNIKFCFLKGISLLVSLYSDLSVRNFADIDLLVAYEDLDKAENVISSLGFRHGDICSDIFIPATKAKIKFQRLHTHELYRFVKKIDSMFYCVDVNYLFSWKGPHKGIDQLKLEEISDSIMPINKNYYDYPILSDNYQFIHLCVHFYNEANYFALDTSYDGKDPKEIRLFRLFDICLLMKRNIHVKTIYEISSKLNIKDKISYVLSLVEYVFDDLIDISEFKKYFVFQKMGNNNNYYLRDGTCRQWPLDFNERIFDISKRENITIKY